MRTIEKMKTKLIKGNRDNISRTIFYEQFYLKHPEIRWALLASFVSRNAGWNMTDLESDWISNMISEDYRHLLFHTFERANWTIFADAYPQLLWYERVKESGTIEEKLLNEFQVSTFMKNEWKHFLREQDQERLCTALIINEQYTIENTIMKHPLYRRAFQTMTYILEEHAHMSYVIFPTTYGDLYGYYVRRFKSVKARIWLGRQLQSLLFHPSLHQSFLDFAQNTPPTGSRRDYEQYTSWRTGNSSPKLRSIYPVVAHEWQEKEDWSLEVRNLHRLFEIKVVQKQPKERTKWLQRKWYELYIMKKLCSLFKKMKGMSKRSDF